MERCPNCNARQRGEEDHCHRCGMDLTALLAIEAWAEHWERQALARLAAGDAGGARAAARRALGLQRRELAAVIHGFVGWLAAET